MGIVPAISHHDVTGYIIKITILPSSRKANDGVLRLIKFTEVDTIQRIVSQHPLKFKIFYYKKYTCCTTIVFIVVVVVVVF